MFTSTKISKSATSIALASVILLSGCKQEELFENQNSDVSNFDQQHSGQIIEGQYIVVFKETSLQRMATTAEMTIRNRSVVSGIRARALETAQLEENEVLQHFEGVINGFTARLTTIQVDQLIRDPNVAYIEKDRYIYLRNGKLREFLQDRYFGKGKGSGKNTGEPQPQPQPQPQPEPDPVPTEPDPTEPAPPSTTPVEPVAPPANTYVTVSPLEGEMVPWNIERVGYGDGTGKTVWIIDSGVDTDHPDLNVDLTRSVSFIYGNDSVEDGFGHGTSVAGIIGAKNNGSGMIGVAANAKIVALRVFDDAGQGTVSRAISAVNHASIYAKPGDVINMSLGSGISSTLDNAVKTAAGKGILFAVAAGNTSVDCSGTSPARVDVPGVFTVSAMDIYHRLWASSNYGASVDYSAPGVNVTVTTKGGNVGGGANGTSFAAPHVAGILLLRGTVFAQGTITGDKDATPDPVASVK